MKNTKPKANQSAKPKANQSAVPKAAQKSLERDYRVCKAAMDDEKVFTELARWGREDAGRVSLAARP